MIVLALRVGPLREVAMGRRHVGVEMLLGLARAGACALALAPVSAIGQSGSVLTGAVLTGTVVDASTHAPLQNVVVTATSPSLQGEQTMLTDETGTYRIPQLPEGTYALRFEREDHRPFVKEAIGLPAGYTLRFNPELIPEVAGATTVNVIGRNPVVDVGSTQQGSVVERDFIQMIPLNPPGVSGANNRSFENVALAVPGVQQDIFGIAVVGATSPENLYMIDGLATRNPTDGTRGSSLSVEFVESVSVLTGGYMPEYGRTTGGIIAANTRSGGNEFHGSVWGTWTPGALTGTPKVVQAPDSVLSFRTTAHNVVDFGFSLGGYLIKDRLWFYVGVQPEFSRDRIERDLTPYRLNPDLSLYRDADGKTQFEAPTYTVSSFADERQVQYFGKLTYLISDNHRLSLTVTGTPSRSDASPLIPGQPVRRGQLGATSQPAFDGTFDVVGKLSSSFAQKRVLLDFIAGWHEEDHNASAYDGSKLGSTDPTAIANQPRIKWAPRSLTEFESLPAAVVADCLSDGNGGRTRCLTSYLTGGPPSLYANRVDTFQGRLIVTVLFEALGHHVLKLGIDGQVSTWEDTFGYGGGAVLEENGVGGRLRTPGYPFGLGGYLSGPDQEVDLPVQHFKTKTVLLGGFVQDSWSILDRVTLNAGVRYESQTVYPNGNLAALSFPNEWSPRLGVIWDFTRNGRSKLYASYARYYENLPLYVAGTAFGSISVLQARYAPASGDCNPTNSITASCRSKDNVVSGGLPPNPSWRVGMASQHEPVDPQIRPPSEDEVVAGIQYEFLPNTRASVTYTHRNIVHWVEDIGVNGSDFFIGNPGYGIGSTYPPARRVYNSFVLALDKVYANGWLAQVSYTYQNLTGNLEGLIRTETQTLFPNANSDFDVHRLAVNREGPLPADIRHTVKAYVAKELVLAAWFSITMGAAYVGASGAPISWLGASSIYQNSEEYLFPRGSGGRLPWQHTIDVNGAVNFKFSKDTVLTLSVNVFNLFNFQQVTGVDENYTLIPPGPGVAPVPNGNPATDRGKIVDDQTGQPLKPSDVNPHFFQPTAYQPPRQVRFQARLSF
jgi:outer membrane receptor protein involved in Fe transport